MYKVGRYMVTSKKIVGFGNNGWWWVLNSRFFSFFVSQIFEHKV